LEHIYESIAELDDKFQEPKGTLLELRLPVTL
jgi:hypothetical protein